MNGPESATIEDERQASAQAAYEAYEFDCRVESQDGWEWTTPGDERTRRVHLDDGTPVSFTVIFEPSGSTIRECYAIDGSGNIFGNSGAAA